MCSKLSSLMLILGAALFVAAKSTAFAEEVSISGVVHSIDGAPIHMIEVTIYREDREVNHVFTGEDGKYAVSVPGGKPVTVRFDTHSSLTNANEWHPSVVANVEGTKNTTLDRTLLPVGAGEDFATFIDALSGYEFAAFWEEKEPDKAYAQSAAVRMGPMKLPTPVLQELQIRLQKHFSERANAP
jgi:hypothetical protein